MAYTFTNVTGELLAINWTATDLNADVYSDGVGDDHLIFEVENLTNNNTGVSPFIEQQINNLGEPTIPDLGDGEVKIRFPIETGPIDLKSSQFPNNIYVHANSQVNIGSSSVVSYSESETPCLYFSFVDPVNVDSNTAFFPVHASGPASATRQYITLHVFTEFMNNLNDYNKIF